MKTIKDLGIKAKAKHPKYRHLSDLEAGKQVKREFPGCYDEFQDTDMVIQTDKGIAKADSAFDKSLSELTGGMNDLSIEPRTEENLQVLLDYYKPTRGVFTSWWQRRKSEGREKLVSQVSNEYLEVIRQGQLLEQAVREGRKTEIEFRMYVAQNALALTAIKANNYLIVEAQKAGLTMENHQQIKLESGLSNIRVDEAQGMSHVKINEHAQITQIDLDRKISEAEHTVRIGIINKFLSEHQKISLIQGLIDGCYKQIDEILKSQLSAEIKGRMIEDRNETIEAFKKDMRVRQTRLLQTNDGQEI